MGAQTTCIAWNLDCNGEKGSKSISTGTGVYGPDAVKKCASCGMFQAGEYTWHGEQFDNGVVSPDRKVRCQYNKENQCNKWGIPHIENGVEGWVIIPADCLPTETITEYFQFIDSRRRLINRF